MSKHKLTEKLQATLDKLSQVDKKITKVIKKESTADKLKQPQPKE